MGVKAINDLDIAEILKHELFFFFQVLDAYFARSFYKHILDIPLSFQVLYIVFSYKKTFLFNIATHFPFSLFF